MKRLLYATAASAAFVLFIPTSDAGAQQPQRSVSEVVKATVDSVVLIVISDESGKPIAEGSGFIASSDGKIVTNHHVIEGAHSAVVKLNNGAFFPVDGVVADDGDLDIAILKVSGKNLPPLQLADSNNLAAGDHVVAIGSPLGLENSVSDGIVSGLRKDASGRSWVQTTAPTSHGNSGGPLLTMNEKVIGVITMKLREGENLNFAVPSQAISTLLTNSTVRPLGTPPVIGSNPSTPSGGDRVWTSLTAGRELSIRRDGDYIYVRWINLPAELRTTAAFMSWEFKKSGDKWVGKLRMSVPIRVGQSQYWCRQEHNAEIDAVTDSRIEGRSEVWVELDPQKCQPRKVEWKPFTWIPK
jgi:Trypsin-like peptidase domain